MKLKRKLKVTRQRSVVLSVSLPLDIVAEIDDEARKRGLARSVVIAAAWAAYKRRKAA